MHLRSALATTIAMISTAALAPLSASSAGATTTSPRPVYSAPGGVADPGMMLSGGTFYAFSTTGTSGRVSSAPSAAGPWTSVGNAVRLQLAPSWVDRTQPIWAPDAWQVGAGYVLYYSAVPQGETSARRCIGVATSSTAAGPYTPTAGRPLVCSAPGHLGEDTTPGRPVASAGVIDPSPFIDSSGRRMLIYKTQSRPSSLRVVRLGAGAQHVASGARSTQVVRSTGIIENPAVVRRGGQYVLFASRYSWEDCTYATVWMHASTLSGLGSATQHPFITTGSGTPCGPGGADVTPSLDGGFRIFLHGWVCGADEHRCAQSEVASPAARSSSSAQRQLFAAILLWSGSTPSLGRFL